MRAELIEKLSNPWILGVMGVLVLCLLFKFLKALFKVGLVVFALLFLILWVLRSQNPTSSFSPSSTSSGGKN